MEDQKKMCRYPDKSVLLFPPFASTPISFSYVHMHLHMDTVGTSGLPSSIPGMLANVVGLLWYSNARCVAVRHVVIHFMPAESLWLLRLGRELVGDVLRVFPRLGHESEKQNKDDGQRPGNHILC